MKVGIVGAEAAKFTPKGEERAKVAIYNIMASAIEVCSGECPLGGIDIWAKEITLAAGKPFQAFPPRDRTWSGGYKPRNLQIARWSDKVYCIAVDKLPPDFKGMRFKECYHCRKVGYDLNHVKGGGCWTTIEAERLGKESEWITIQND